MICKVMGLINVTKNSYFELGDEVGFVVWQVPMIISIDCYQSMNIIIGLGQINYEMGDRKLTRDYFRCSVVYWVLVWGKFANSQILILKAPNGYTYLMK